MARKKNDDNGSLEEGTQVFLNDVPEQKAFYCFDGTTFRNLDELKKSLKNMSEDTFNYHASSERNDFSNWIYDVIGDVTLANSIRDVFDRKAAAKKISSRITAIKKKSGSE